VEEENCQKIGVQEIASIQEEKKRREE